MFMCCTNNDDAAQEVALMEPEVQQDNGAADFPGGLQTQPLLRPTPAVVAVPTDGALEAPAAPAEEVAPAQPAEEAAAPEAVAEATPAAPAAKDPDVEEFEVECTKKTAGEFLGLNLVNGRELLVVTGVVDGGMIARWNEAHPTQQIKYGSVIYDVNGVTSGLKLMLQEVVNSDTMTLKVRRHRRYRVTVEKKAVLGLDMKSGTTTVLRIAKPSQALKEEDISLHGWNTSCPAGSEIMAGDRVVEVNGVEGTSVELIKRLKESSGQLSITFARE